VVISDLQLGEELYLAEEMGVFVPQTQLKEIEADLAAILEVTRARQVIVNGDLKHEFGEASHQEWREVRELIEFLRQKVDEIIVVRGNHDNYLLTIAGSIGIQVYDPYYFAEGTAFTHGHRRIEYPRGIETLVIGHEQPAIVLKRGFDTVKVPCLLYGKTKTGEGFVCLPAFSPLSEGTALNVEKKDELLSPILREDVDIEQLRPIGLDKETGALEFPTMKHLMLGTSH
jgi:putative SbcD/Mre11-related phosphoesterase